MKLFSRYTDDGYPLGLIPSPHDVSYFLDMPTTSIAGLPSNYDLRGRGRLTSIKNQVIDGPCWAFATYGSLESFLLPSENWDFSERNLVENHGFDARINDGGNLYFSAAYLARWNGPVDEKDDPYIYSAEGKYPVKKHVQDIVFIPPKKGYLDNDLIKQAVMDLGAVYVSMYWKLSCYNNTNMSYYNPGYEEGGHAVCIVGWDDNFNRNKFNTIPPGNGAFIVRNSWGRDWGESGYFYVSYYDEFFARMDRSAAFKAENTTNYDVIYQYDPLGWTRSLTIGYGTDTAWFANIFMSTSTDVLAAVSFYTASIQNSYEIYVYKDVAPNMPRSGTLATTKTGQINSLGYFTVPLDNVVPLRLNQRFSVVVRLRTHNYGYPIPVEKPYPGYSSRATANPGESFVSPNGTSWTDLQYAGFINSNVCLKAFAKKAEKFRLIIQAEGGGTTDPPPGDHFFNPGENVVLTAMPNIYHTFTNWSGNASGSAEPLTITMDSDKSITAHFRYIHPPHASGRKVLNRTFSQAEYINILSWQANSANAGLNISKYKIYVFVNGTPSLLTEVASDVKEFHHRNAGKERRDYRIVAIHANGRDGAPAHVVVQ